MLNTTGTTVGILFRRSTLALSVVGALALAGAVPALAQDVGHTSQGGEFWVVFQKNFRDHVVDEQTMQSKPAHPLRLELEISSAVAAKGYAEIPSLGFRRDFKVIPGQLLRIPIDSAAQLRGSEVVEKLGVHVVTTAPVTLTGLSARYQSTDTYLALPVDALGTVYRAVGYKWLQEDLLSQLAIVATDDATVVTIAPSVATAAGHTEPFTVTLDRGDVYQVIPRFSSNTSSDLTGTLVTATKPIALFSGHNCAYVPDKSVKACNLLVEQLPPVSAWGTGFVVVPLADRPRSVYRVVASEENTELRVDGKVVATLDAGEYHDGQTNSAEANYLSSSRPVLVTQFSTGFDDRFPAVLFSTRSYDAAAIPTRAPDTAGAPDVRRWISPRGAEVVDEGTTFNPPPPRAYTDTIVRSKRKNRGTRKNGSGTGFFEEVETPKALDGVGDPMMLLIPASTTYLSEYTIHTPASGPWHHFINVVAPADAVETFRIDDRAVDVEGIALSKRFAPVGTSGWFSARIEIGDGTHRVSASAPIGIYQYGFGVGENSYDAYGNAAGGSTAKRE